MDRDLSAIKFCLFQELFYRIFQTFSSAPQRVLQEMEKLSLNFSITVETKETLEGKSLKSEVSFIKFQTRRCLLGFHAISFHCSQHH